MNDGRLKVVGIGRTLREGSTSLGTLRRALGAAEAAADEDYGGRLDKLGWLVVQMAARLRPETEPAERLLRATA